MTEGASSGQKTDDLPPILLVRAGNTADTQHSRMNYFRNLPLKTKLFLTFLFFSIVPVLILGAISIRATSQATDTSARAMQSESVTLMSRIERNMFERYGDAQAFSLHPALQKKETWYDASPKAPIAQVMNRYLSAYRPIYAMSLMVDLNGKPIAVSSASDEGKVVPTSPFMKKSYAGEKWLENVRSGRFLETKDLSGTWVDDVTQDDAVKQAFGGDGHVICFSAPVKDASGKTIAVWRNYARMKVLEDILIEGNAELRAMGYKTSELTLIDAQGRLITEYDPGARKTEEYVNDADSLLKLNLAEEGVAAAKLAVAGKTGWVESVHYRKGIPQVAGYSHSGGALGYPGLGWNMLVRVSSGEIFAAANSVRRMTIILAVTVCVLICAAAVGTARFVTRMVNEMNQAIDAVTHGTPIGEISYVSKDEFGQLADGFRNILAKLQEVVGWANRIARGELTVPTDERVVTETDTLGKAFRGMVLNLAGMLAEVLTASKVTLELSQRIGDASDTIAEAAEEVAGRTESILLSVDETVKASDSVAEASTAQAGHLDVVTRQTRQISEALAGIAAAAAQVSLATAHAVVTANDGGEAVQGTLKGMGEIGRATEEASVRLSELQAKSSQITSIVQLIDSIADQTNLLALNAAIEAARAGAQGRGFAVVAEEVRKLAEKSQQATREIGALVAEVNTLIDRSSVAMSETQSAVTQNASRTESARSALENLVATVKGLDEPVLAVVEQSGSAEKIAAQTLVAVNEVSESTMQNAAAAEQMAAGAQEVGQAVRAISRSVGEQSAKTVELRAQAQEMRDVAQSVNDLGAAFTLQAASPSPETPAVGTHSKPRLRVAA